jgi:hypothetical protein
MCSSAAQQKSFHQARNIYSTKPAKNLLLKRAKDLSLSSAYAAEQHRNY